MAQVSMKEMLEAGVHFGHRSQFWHPKMEPFIYGVRNKVHIINLEHTLPKLIEALNFVSSIAAKGEEVLFVGTKRSASEAVKECAIGCGMPYVNHRWLGGMLTNYKTIRDSIKRLQDLEFLSENNFAQFSKREALTMRREMEKLERALGGIKNMKGIPSAVFVVDIGYEKNAVREARKLNVPIVGVVDSNYSPDGIDYVIPGNDDSIRAIHLYTRHIANAIMDSRVVTDEPTVSIESKQESKFSKTVQKETPVPQENVVDEQVEVPAEEGKSAKESDEAKETPQKAMKKTAKTAAQESEATDSSDKEQS